MVRHRVNFAVIPLRLNTMQTLQAILMISGESPCVLELADGKLGGHVKQRNPIGSTALTGEPLTENHVIVEIPISGDDDKSSFMLAQNWLEKHRTVLLKCDARKILEFHTYLESNTGSRLLTIPNSLIRICSDLKLDVANQAIRILTEQEYADLKR